MAKTRTLAFELLRQLAIVTLVPLGVTIAFFVWQLFPHLTKNIIDEQQSIASIIAQQVIERISTAEQQVQLLVELSLKKINTDDLLESYINQKSDFDTIYFLNSKGAIQTISIRGTSAEATSKLYTNMDLSQSVILRDRSESSGWTRVFLSIVTGRLSIAYFEQVDEQLLVAELAIDRLPRLSKRLSDLGILVMLLDSNGELIAHPDPSLSQQQINLSHLSLLNPDKSSLNVYSQEFEWNDEMYFGTLVRMEDLGWSVIVAEEESSIRRDLYYVLRNWLISIGIIIILALIIALKRSSSFSKRFKVLNRQAREIAQGHYHAEVVEEDIKEFKELSENVVFMSEAISKREDELYNKEREVREMNEVLEQRVKERTELLSQANKELETTVFNLNNTKDQLVQSEKLASLGSLVAGVAHELNTPIGNASMASSSLKDFAEKVSRDLEDGSMTKSSLEKFLSDAIMATGITSRNLEKASELIVSFKQVAADQSSSQRREFLLTELVNEILVTLHPQTKKKSINFQLDIEDDLTLDSFPGPLGQVLSNLIMNAFLHGFDEMESGEIRISATSDKTTVEIEVRDNGKGIPDQAVDKIFDPFYTTKLGKGGSGLGLHICHNIVIEVLGGSIQLDTHVNEGAKFILKIPLSAPSTKP